ncbi:hypothetical protein OLMES_5260 [Oleiphilus messinensis]|uniref:Lipoprotein n=1 Tax=Oleiphilus messinensis TaxID=141451 RepID=A0A1Y0IIM1_9GAMM|nr:hypothetical protein [Oleiphilus messinensis]ARU59244.1 hypothetical protein OLMES_5260 [Oleiphilus messinensis]
MDSLRKFVSLASIALLIPACTFTPQSVSAEQSNGHCEASYATSIVSTSSILVGTDVVDSTSFEFINTQSGSEFDAEIGGATASVKLSTTNGESSLIRSFFEPGLPVQTQQYNVLCVKDGRLSATGLTGQFVVGGVLLLESSSNVEGLPSDLWIYYRLKK